MKKTNGQIRARARLAGAIATATALTLGMGHVHQSPAAATDANATDATATFDWFEYTGRDAVLDTPASQGTYRNPVLAGFYPDPSVTRVGDKFYLVNSTFTYFPGIPLFESTDLVHWTLKSHVISRRSQLDFDGLGISRGVFAPDIEYHDGTFYVLNTAVDNGGNFFVTAKDPAGPWSDPVWLRELDGIDPSLFFDRDGKAYVLNNGPPEGKPRYAGHRAIWMQQIDLQAGRLVGPRKVLIDGGVEPAKNPIWIEGPHLYRHNGWYYLMCAEGGTARGHSQVILRAHSVWGPFEPYAGNPILTQRDLPDDRPIPITNAGHADLVEGPDGSWWAIFLASRPYGQTDRDDLYNTGRETFLLPVTWRDGWPVILPGGKPIPYVVRGPTFMARDASQAPFGGNFTWRDDFSDSALDPTWIFIRVPRSDWADLRAAPGALTIHAKAEPLSTLMNPSFIGRRQQHLAFDATTRMLVPAAAGVSAGLAVFQSAKHWYFMGARRTQEGAEIFLERQSGGEAETIATRPLPAMARPAMPAPATAENPALTLRVTADGPTYSFFYDAGQDWQPLRLNEDGRLLSTAIAGGFVGVVLGPYARADP